jgi:hypothetical protein
MKLAAWIMTDRHSAVFKKKKIDRKVTKPELGRDNMMKTKRLPDAPLDASSTFEGGDANDSDGHGIVKFLSRSIFRNIQRRPSNMRGNWPLSPERRLR